MLGPVHAIWSLALHRRRPQRYIVLLKPGDSLRRVCHGGGTPMGVAGWARVSARPMKADRPRRLAGQQALGLQVELNGL
jgi:hypothetical protein